MILPTFKKVIISTLFFSFLTLSTPLIAQQEFELPQYPIIKVMGFSDFTYDSEEEDVELGQAVAHVIGRFDENSTIFGEFALTENDNDFETSTERLIFRYDFNDLYKLSVGKFHTPVGFWNATYHHGAWLQTTINRPRAFKFGSSIVPIHFKGVILEGNIINSDLGIGYRVGTGRGLHQNFSRIDEHEDNHSHSDDTDGEDAITLQVYSRPSMIRGLNIGLSYYVDSIPVSPHLEQIATEIDDEIFGVYVALEKESPEIIAEYIHFSHEEQDGLKEKTSGDGYYVQMAYRLSQKWQSLQPYARFDKVDIDQPDVLIKKDQNFEGITLGLRFDFSNYVALKFEYRDEELGIHKEQNDIFEIQLSFVLD